MSLCVITDGIRSDNRLCELIRCVFCGMVTHYCVSIGCHRDLHITVIINGWTSNCRLVVRRQKYSCSVLFCVSAGVDSVKQVSKPSDVTRRHAFRSRNSIAGREMKDNTESEVGGTQRFFDVSGLYYLINTRFYSLLCVSFSFVIIIQKI